jgi:hypothetical protein
VSNQPRDRTRGRLPKRALPGGASVADHGLILRQRVRGRPRAPPRRGPGRWLLH